AHRSVARKAVDVEHPGKRSENRVIGREIAIGPGLPERGDREQDKGRVELTQILPPEIHRSEVAGAEALDDNIGRGGELTKQLRAARSRDIKGQRSFVEIVEPEEQTAVAMRLVIYERADGASVVATRRFDLDHIGPHVGEQPSSELSPIGAQ